MTRINLVSPVELSDQHLIAEYHELPRVLKQNINTTNAPKRYCLGKGHVKWAKSRSLFLHVRYLELVNEMLYRGFKVNYSWRELIDGYPVKPSDDNFYISTKEDVALNKARLIEKYKLKPDWYKWTKRNKPEYYK